MTTASDVRYTKDVTRLPGDLNAFAGLVPRRRSQFGGSMAKRYPWKRKTCAAVYCEIVFQPRTGKQIYCCAKHREWPHLCMTENCTNPIRKRSSRRSQYCWDCRQDMPNELIKSRPRNYKITGWRQLDREEIKALSAAAYIGTVEDILACPALLDGLLYS